MSSEQLEEPREELGTRARDIAQVLWPAFLAACAASLLFFALFDPAELGAAATPPFELGRTAGYTLGFLFFWAVAVLASAMTLFMARTGRRARDAEHALRDAGRRR